MNKLNRFTRKAFRPMLSLALLAALPAAAEAQFSVGIKGGLVFATLSENDLSPDFSSRTGWLAGAHLTLGAGLISIQPEALIAQLGTEAGDDELKTNYLMIPVNLRLNLSVGAPVQPFILAGPYAGFKLSCDINDLDCSDDIESTDFGVDVGAGLKFGGRFFAEARYALGLKEISDAIPELDSKNRAFVIMAGITF
jgi:hypothetical protein